MLDWLKKKVTVTPSSPPQGLEPPPTFPEPKLIDVGKALIVLATKDGRSFTKTLTGDYLGENPLGPPGNDWIVDVEEKVRVWHALGNSTGHLSVDGGGYVATSDVSSFVLDRSEHKVRAA